MRVGTVLSGLLRLSRLSNPGDIPRDLPILLARPQHDGFGVVHIAAARMGALMMGFFQKGGIADITISDVHQSNGVIQVIDKVLMPGA